MSHVKKEKTEQKRDPDFVHAEAAMKRAAQRAREEARQGGVGVVYMENGKIIQESVEEKQ